MELATNSFNKGILMDTHPMVLGNDSLTDCLNGTLITMDGNEVILQNDMGNRKVDNAYLPAGYQPVGIKEHGGIIYVASYNPITNKSLIGSFPSPERKISSNDKSDLGGKLDLESLLEEDPFEHFLTKDSILIPVSGNSILHPGDKFILYGNLNEYKTDITNYNNTDGTKVISPKNKKYTLQLGILNSQNQFVDITKNLLRWKNNEIVHYDSSVSDLYKFNDGYFIPNEVTIPELDQTIDDKILLEERLALPTNNYLNKLNGPLYLKASLNHISNFSYSISANILDDKLKIVLNAIVEYNCPDTNTTITNPDPTNDINYKSYYEVVPTYDFFDFFSNPLVHDDDDIELKLISSEKSKSIYNPNTNLYKCNINNVYTLKVKENNLDYILKSDELKLLIEKGIKYDIKAKVPYLIKTNPDSTKTYTYLKKFSYNGEINVSNYGVSGINKWKFKYTDNSLIIDFAIGDGNGINDLKFLFTNVTNDSDSTTFPNNSDSTTTNPIGNNATSIEGTINLSNLTTKALYKVTWSYTRNGGESIEAGDRWVIVNGMFNECYNSINDFGIESEEILSKAHFGVSLTVSTTNTITTKNIKEEKSGKLFSLTDQTGSIIPGVPFLRKEENAINQATIKIQQNNNTLPSFLTLDLSKVSVSVPSEVSVPNTNVSIELNENSILKVNTNTIKVQSNLKIPSFLAPTTFESRICKNVFVSMYDFIYDLINNKTTVYGGCYVISGKDTNNAVKSKFRVYKSTREQISRKINMDEAINDGYYKGALVAERNYFSSNQAWNSNNSSIDSNIIIRNKMFDELAGIGGKFTIPSDQVFLWGYNDNNNNLDCKSYITNDPLMLNYMSKSNEIYGEHNEFCRFFWKSNQTTDNSNTKWALMPEPIYNYHPGNFAYYFWDKYLPEKYQWSKFAYYKEIYLYVPDISNNSTYTDYEIPINGQIYGVELNNNYKSLFSSWIPDFTPIISESESSVELCTVSSDLGIRNLVSQLQDSNLNRVDLVKDIINSNLNNVDSIYDYDDKTLSDSIFNLYTDNNTTLRLPLYNLQDTKSSWLKNCPRYNKKPRFDACWAKINSTYSQAKPTYVQAGFEYTNTYAVKI